MVCLSSRSDFEVVRNYYLAHTAGPPQWGLATRLDEMNDEIAHHRTVGGPGILRNPMQTINSPETRCSAARLSLD